MVSVHRFPGRDGLGMAYREVGLGRPIVLLHGFAATSSMWLHSGLAGALARRGRRVILPDLRGHGHSARPHDPASYPVDVLADDSLALVERLGLRDYDLGGHSIGARTVLRMLVRGARPAHAIVLGQGLGSIIRERRPGGLYQRVLTALANGDAIKPGSLDAELARSITRSGGDPRALLHVLGTLVPTLEATLSRIAHPTLVATGVADTVDGAALAAVLPGARFARVPGDHLTSLASPELATTILSFLNGRGR